MFLTSYDSHCIISMFSIWLVLNFLFFWPTDDPKKVDHLLKLDGAKERLQLYKADLREEGCFDLAVKGCEGVFHTASPCFMDVKDPQVHSI